MKALLSFAVALICTASVFGQDWQWTDADIPAKFERYERATKTQRIAVTNGADSITPVSRENLEEKWRVPGGMVGIDGWKSTLYKWASGQRFVADIPVWNGSNFQNNRGYKRSYDDGSEFMDVLTNTQSGKVFEVRKAVKSDGAWQRFVVYRDPGERPWKYNGHAGLDCKGCHNKSNGPGTGGYAQGLLSGSDEIFSDPIPELEGR